MSTPERKAITMIHDWDLVTTNLGRLRDREYEVAVIATSAIESHNDHLPEGQDFLHANTVARRAVEAAWPRCESVLLLPGLPYGVDCNLMDFPLSIHVSQAVLDAMLREIVVSLRHHGIRKIVIVNGHGGNDFTPFVRQIQADLDVHVFVCNWWTAGADKYSEIFDKPDDHAGQLETSVALALFPDLVELDRAKDGAVAPFRFEALERGWVKTSRRFSRLNNHSAAGNPAGASAERGKAYIDLVVGRLADFLVELSTTPIDDAFPQQPISKK